MKSIQLVFLTILGCFALALTPIERQSVERAYQYIKSAQSKTHEQELVIQGQDQEINKLDQLSEGQQAQIIDLSNQIDKAHQHEGELAKYNAYAKPIIDRVNKRCGLGAIGYGISRLTKCFMFGIFGLVGVAVIIIVIGLLTGTLPAIRAFFGTVGSFLAAVFRRIGSIFRKKP